MQVKACVGRNVAAENVCDPPAARSRFGLAAVAAAPMKLNQTVLLPPLGTLISMKELAAFAASSAVLVVPQLTVTCPVSAPGSGPIRRLPSALQVRDAVSPFDRTNGLDRNLQPTGDAGSGLVPAAGAGPRPLEVCAKTGEIDRNATSAAARSEWLCFFKCARELINLPVLVNRGRHRVHVVDTGHGIDQIVFRCKWKEQHLINQRKREVI